MNDPRTLELVTDWQAARDRCDRLEHRWVPIRAVLWLLAAVAILLLFLSAPVVAPLILVAAAGTLCGDHAMRMMRADVVKSEAWAALAEHTGLDDAGLNWLVGADENEIGGAL